MELKHASVMLHVLFRIVQMPCPNGFLAHEKPLVLEGIMHNIVVLTSMSKITVNNVNILLSFLQCTSHFRNTSHKGLDTFV